MLCSERTWADARVLAMIRCPHGSRPAERAGEPNAARRNLPAKVLSKKMGRKETAIGNARGRTFFRIACGYTFSECHAVPHPPPSPALPPRPHISLNKGYSDCKPGQCATIISLMHAAASMIRSLPSRAATPAWVVVSNCIC